MRKVSFLRIFILLSVFGGALSGFLLWPRGGMNRSVGTSSLVFPVCRDTFISAVGTEVNGSNGAENRLKLKGPQEYTLLDADFSDLHGRLIGGAVLHVRSAVPVAAPLGRISISTVASPWVEGDGRRYKNEIGSSSFSQAALKKRNWSYNGSSVMDVVLGRGNTLWRLQDCTPPDRKGWQVCSVDPDVIAARVAGLSYGFFLYDDIGTVWSINRGQFSEEIFPNRFFYSREKRSSAPWFEIKVKGNDDEPPGVVGKVQARVAGLPPGQAVVSWQTPDDTGGAKVLGYKVEYTRQNGGRVPFPRYLIPLAGKAAGTVKMHIQDIPFAPGEQVEIFIRSVDSAGNVGLPVSRSVTLSGTAAAPSLSAVQVPNYDAAGQLPVFNGLQVSVVDLLDKIDPVTGEIIPSHRPGYKRKNYLFSSAEKLIQLQSAGNETIAFQVNIEGKADNISAKLQFDTVPEVQTKIFQSGYVKSGKTGGEGGRLLPDPLVPVSGTFSIPSTAGKNRVLKQENLSLICEIYVPHDVPAGEKAGRLIFESGGDVLELDVRLKVWDFTLPDVLSFVPEMNAYSTVSPFKGYEYYRLAHEHRTCLNRLPYGWDGQPAFAPKWKNGEGGFTWTEWDNKVGPLLDGSAFADLPRRGVPLDVFYLPVNENWPIPLAGYYTPSYWADQAFDEAYMSALQGALSEFAGHSRAMGWNTTRFQFYLNNKVGYRKKNSKSSAPWNFDEPIDTKDFWALRWYGVLFQSAIADSAPGVEFWYRADISYPQFGRNILSGITDIEYIGGNNYQKTRQKQDERFLYGDACFAEYGNVNLIEEPNTRAVLWCLSAWSNGAGGVLPWQTIGSSQSWVMGEQTALFYPAVQGPMPSVRLKAFTRGQQDVEYLELFRRVYGVPRWQVVEMLKSELNVQEENLSFSGISPYALWKLRYRLGEMISRKHPPYQRSLVELKKPPWHPELLPDIGRVQSANPAAQEMVPECDASCFSTRNSAP